jgi:hypothetical protein
MLDDAKHLLAEQAGVFHDPETGERRGWRRFFRQSPTRAGSKGARHGRL